MSLIAIRVVVCGVVVRVVVCRVVVCTDALFPMSSRTDQSLHPPTAGSIVQP
jgi:hypothetical protein